MDFVKRISLPAGAMFLIPGPWRRLSNRTHARNTFKGWIKIWGRIPKDFFTVLVGSYSKPISKKPTSKADSRKAFLRF